MALKKLDVRGRVPLPIVKAKKEMELMSPVTSSR